MAILRKLLVLSCLAAAVLPLLPQHARAQARPKGAAVELKNPRMQLTLQLLEVAQGQLNAALQQYPALHDGLAKPVSHVDGAIRNLDSSLAAVGTKRAIAPGVAGATDHPIDAALDTLQKANEELTKGIPPDDLKGGVKTATENIRLAIREVEALAKQAGNAPVMPAVVPAVPPAAVPVESGPPRLLQALHRHYPNAQFHVNGASQENNIEVYRVDVTPQGGQPFVVTATERGDFIASGEHVGPSAANLPQGVQTLMHDIFRVPPTDVWALTATYYWVTLAAPGTRDLGSAQASNSQQYAVRFDPAGRVLGIKSPNQLRNTGWQTFPEAPADVSQKLREIVSHHFPTAKINAIKQVPQSPGFYHVALSENAAEGRLIVDANGRISIAETTVAANTLPQPILDTIHAAFNGDTLLWAGRDDMHLYQISERIGNQTIEMFVQADGEVLEIETNAHAK